MRNAVAPFLPSQPPGEVNHAFKAVSISCDDISVVGLEATYLATCFPCASIRNRLLTTSAVIDPRSGGLQGRKRIGRQTAETHRVHRDRPVVFFDVPCRALRYNASASDDLYLADTLSEFSA